MQTASSTRQPIAGKIGALEIVPLDAALGAEVRGLDLRRLGDTEFAVLHRAFLDHLVLLVRDQPVTDDDLVAVARRFGELEMAPSGKERSSHQRFDGPPEITVVSNVRVNDVPIGELGDSEVIWHSDYSFKEIPAGMRLLHALEIPPASAGGNTQFLNTYAAYDMLPAELKRMVHGRTIKHDTAYDTNRNLRLGAQPVTDVRLSPGPTHPIVTTHQESGHNSLFLGRKLFHYVNGLSVADSAALLDHLWAHAAQDRFIWEHEWRVGDVVIWDNRCTLHRRGPFAGDTRRVLHAAQVRGQRPAEAPDAQLRPPHPRSRLFGHAGGEVRK